MREAADPGERERGSGKAAGRAVDLEAELLAASRELHRLGREVESLRERLRAEREERAELLTVVSHELRTPLTVIRGYHRMLLAGEAGELGAEQRRFLEESSRSAERLDAFLEKVLDASREPLGGEVLEVATGPLEPLLREVLEALRPLTERRRLRLGLTGPSPPPMARFDRGAVERVMRNLIENAVRFATEGGLIEIATRCVEREGRRFVEVAVSDDGPGVAPQDRERIFAAYVQAEDGGRGGGLGLGLAICRRLVEAHGGRMRLSQRRGGGACFSFTLPRAEP